MKFYLLVIFDSLILSTAQILLKKGAAILKAASAPSDGFWDLLILLVKNVYVWSGLFLMGVAFLIWLFILSKVNLGIIYPISASLTIIFVSIASWLFLKDVFSAIQILGIASIILGIFLLLKP